MSCSLKTAVAGDPGAGRQLAARLPGLASGLYGHLYLGEMDRYVERLDSAASDADKAKRRPDDDEDEQDDECLRV